jgi:TatD DNase family protein
MFIDSHAHIDSLDFEPDRGAMLERARLAQVERILAVASGTGSKAMDAVIRLVEEHPFLDLAVGLHPHEANSANNSSFDLIKKVASHSKVVAWGEIGLDFHYDYSPRAIQKSVFIQQLALAKESDLPVIIHTREAEAETLEILKRYDGGGGRGGILHCFTGSLVLAEECIEMGFMVSFSGVLTFPKAGAIRDVAQKIPLDRLLIETDSPYLAPIPYRGKRNEPAYLVETAQALAQLRGLSVNEVAGLTAKNYRRFFRMV